MESAAPIIPPTIRRREKRTKEKDCGSKRQRVHPPSKPRDASDLAGFNGPTIGELKVYAVRLIQPKDGGEEWFQGVFSATLSNKQKCLLKTNKDIWLGRQCDVDMSRLRDVIM